MNKIAHNIFVATQYDGVNVGAIHTQDGVIAIDAPSYAKQARDWVLQLNALHHKSIQNLVLTDYNGDRIINSRWFNSPIIAHTKTAQTLSTYDRRYPAPLLDSLLARHSELGRQLSSSPVAKATISFSDDFCMYKGQYEFHFLAAPGPTKGNIWVFIPDARILFVGDTLTTTTPPIIIDGDSQLWLQTLNKLQQWQDKVDVIVPGRGPIGDDADIDRLYHYLDLMRLRMGELIDAERPFAETAVYISEFMALYPNHHLPVSWVRQQIHHTLNQIYHEIKLSKDGIVMV